MNELERQSPCKVNLLLNILGKRSDGFHELETIMHPIPVFDSLSFRRRASSGISLSCNLPSLPCDSGNLVYRAAAGFFDRTKIPEGIEIHLEKRVPLAAGLGGGSGNAAATLSALNELFGSPLTVDEMQSAAALLGSDVPFFLQSAPGMAVGRGEIVTPLREFASLRNLHVLLIHPGFGVATAWAYQNLANYPEALNGRKGRALKLVEALQHGSIQKAAPLFYNSLEAPVLAKYPILKIYQEFLIENGASVAKMSGSGSATFAFFESENTGYSALERFHQKFGSAAWTKLVELKA